MKLSVPASFVAVVACQDVFLAPQISTGMIVGSGMEVDLQNASGMSFMSGVEVDGQADSCLNFLNGLRSQHGLSPLTLMSSQMSCAANQAQGDSTTSAHEHFTACGEAAQCEASWSGTGASCEQGIQMYYNEGPSGGHYKIIMSSDYKSMSYGHCNNCGSDGTFYTHDFFWGSGPSPTPPPAPTPSPSSASCDAHHACSGLTGDCCPTTDGVQLDCCSAHLEVMGTSPIPPPANVTMDDSCYIYIACWNAGLGHGDCCPTKDGVWLDCCNE